jgi:hypothetical protein
MNTKMMSADGPHEQQPQQGSLGVAHGSAGLVTRLRALADDDRYCIDDWSQDICRQAADEIERLIADEQRLDWLADRENKIGNVQLPRECIQVNMHSMRAAIDAAMALPNK